MTDANLIEVFCILDEFCKYFAPKLKEYQCPASEKRHSNKKSPH